MRLRRLDLTRYGKFTDQTIDFGPAIDGRPDLHIVFGLNEAGKSTTQSAFLDLLFGIHPQSPYDFLHHYNTMRVGAVLDTANGPREFARIKRKADTLLGPDNLPIPAGSLAAELGGLDRDSYRAMFCLDDDTLQAGGESILASKGELGQLLFSASSGFADLSRTLQKLREEADEFSRQSGALSKLKDKLAELKAEGDRLNTIASAYRRHVDARNVAAKAYQQVQQDRDTTRRALETIRRETEAEPWLQKWRMAQDSEVPLAALPEPPQDWANTQAALQRDDIELATRAKKLGQDISEAAATLAAITVEAAALPVAARLTALDTLRSRHVTAEKDLPTRIEERDEAARAITELLRQLDRAEEADPARLLLTVAQTARLQQRISARSGIVKAVQTARQEHDDALCRLCEARRLLAEAGRTGDSGLATETTQRRLADILAALRATDHASQQRKAERVEASAKARLDAALAALLPWHGLVSALAAMTVPDDAQISDWISALDKTERNEARAQDQLTALETDQARLQGELNALSTSVGGLDQQAGTTIRAEREHAWAEHRRQLAAASADRFETALRRDDAAMLAQLSHQAQLARLHETTSTLAGKAAEAKRVQIARDLAATARASVTQAITDAMASIPGLATPMPPDSLRSWLARRKTALEAQAALTEAALDLRTAQNAAGAAHTELRAALVAAAITHDPKADIQTLRDIADTAMTDHARITALRSAEAERDREANARATALTKAEATEQAFHTDWQAACANCWLATRSPLPEPETVSAILPILSDLARKLDSRNGLAERIGAMVKDQVLFTHEIHALAAMLDIPLGDTPPLALHAAVQARVLQAQADHKRREDAVHKHDKLHVDRRTLTQEQERHNASRQARFELFQVDSLAAVDTALRQVDERCRHRAEIAGATTELARLLATATGAEAEARLAAATPEARAAERDRLDQTLAHQDADLQRLYAQQQQAADQLAAIGGDDAVARIEEQRRTLMLQIEQEALSHLRLRAGIAAAERALLAYRDRHQTAMMRHASEAFRAITRGAYQRLSSQRERDSEVLIAIPADGPTKQAHDLSKGTRFQLYLALRAAGYREFAAMHRAVPFIADDILETFDNYRAEEAMRVLADMAQTGQVICLTHHQHLCDIARQVLPEVRVHVLIEQRLTC